MERVKKGERYWYIYFGAFGIEVFQMTDKRDKSDDATFGYNNYFATKEEAEACARKLRAVLKGADVIEMPSDEEIWEEANSRYPRRWSGDRENGEKFDVFMEGIDYVKSKIVK